VAASAARDLVGVAELQAGDGLRAGGRSAGIPVIIGGYHITELPGSLTADMDVGVIGEVSARSASSWSSSSSRVRCPPPAGQRPRIVYWDAGERVVTAPREVIGKASRSLDELPMPDRSMIGCGPTPTC